MTTEPGGFRVATARVHLPLITYDDSFHWDGVSPVSRDKGPNISSKHTLPSMHAARSFTETPTETQCLTAMGRHAGQSFTRNDLCPVHSSAPQAINWTREAACLTVSLDQKLESFNQVVISQGSVLPAHTYVQENRRCLGAVSGLKMQRSLLS
jgi:hypothetical protein